MSKKLEDISDRDALVKEYWKYIENLSLKYKMVYGVLDMEDIFQAGIYGLLQAANKFDPKAGVNFKTFAHSRIKGAMVDEIRSIDPLSRGQRFAVDVQNGSKKATDRQMKTNKYLRQNKTGKVVTFYFEQPTLIAKGSSTLTPLLLKDVIPDQHQHHVVSKTEAKITLSFIMEKIDTLREKDKLIIYLFYYEGKKIREIAKLLSMTNTGINIAKKRALNKMKDFINNVEHPL